MSLLLQKEVIIKAFDFSLQLYFQSTIPSSSRDTISLVRTFQWQIIRNSIVLEKFFSLLYYVDKGDDLPRIGKNKCLNEWFHDSLNPFKYFIVHYYKYILFQIEYRHNEAHNVSRYTYRLLSKDTIEPTERNRNNNLLRRAQNAWKPFVEICQWGKPNYYSTPWDDDDLSHKAMVAVMFWKDMQEIVDEVVKRNNWDLSWVSTSNFQEVIDKAIRENEISW